MSKQLIYSCLFLALFLAGFHHDLLASGWNFAARVEQSETCAGSRDGIVRITGVPGFSRALYSLDGEYWQASPVFRGLSQGVYQPRVQFEDGSVARLAEVLVGSPSVLRLDYELESDSLSEQVVLKASASGGVGAIWYSLDGELAVPQAEFRLDQPGRHILLAEDERGCFVRQEILVGSPQL